MPCGINLGRVKRGSGTHLHFMPHGFRAGLQTAGRTPGKSNVVLRGGYPSETSLSLTITLSDFPFTLWGHVLRGGCTTAAVGSGEFCGPKCWIAGRRPGAALEKPRGREVTCRSSLALAGMRASTRGITGSCGVRPSMAAPSPGAQRAFPAPS